VPSPKQRVIEKWLEFVEERKSFVVPSQGEEQAKIVPGRCM
jgi:hypothetical protein